MFEISLAHKSHILHACHEKANYMRVGHVALNSAESDSSDTISYSQKPNGRIQFVSATLVFGLAAFDCSLAISSSHTSLGVL